MDLVAVGILKNKCALDKLLIGDDLNEAFDKMELYLIRKQFIG